MEPDSEPSSNDKVPSFFSNHDKNTDKIYQKKNNEDNSFDSLPKSSTGSSKLIINWPSLGIGVLIAVACIFCGILIANMINTESIQNMDQILIKEINPTKKLSLSSFIDNASPLLGNRNAPLTLIEFGDYQCTFCNKFFHETEELIITNYVKTGKVKILFKDFIVVGEDSIHAANAAHCANDQKMFWQYHSILYHNWAGEGTGWVSTQNLNEFANTLELNMDEFSECVSELKWKELVNLSHEDGIVAGVTATPTFFIIDENNNVLKITGAQPYDVFKEVFESILEK